MSEEKTNTALQPVTQFEKVVTIGMGLFALGICVWVYYTVMTYGV